MFHNGTGMCHFGPGNNRNLVTTKGTKKSNTCNHRGHRGTQRKLKEVRKSKAEARARRKTPEGTKKSNTCNPEDTESTALPLIWTWCYFSHHLYPQQKSAPAIFSRHRPLT